MTMIQIAFIPIFLVLVLLLTLIIYFLKEKGVISGNTYGKMIFILYALIPLLTGILILCNYLWIEDKTSISLPIGLITLGIEAVLFIIILLFYIKRARAKGVEDVAEWSHF